MANILYNKNDVEKLARKEVDAVIRISFLEKENQRLRREIRRLRASYKFFSNQNRLFLAGIRG